MASTTTSQPSLRDVLINPRLGDFMPVGPPGPLFFEKEYHHLAVDAHAAGRFFVDIHVYRNNEMNNDPKHETRTAEQKCYYPLLRLIRASTAGDPELENDPKDPTVVFRRTQDEMPLHAYFMSDQFEFIRKQELYNAFTGKGSPDEISAALRLGIRFGLFPADTQGLQDLCDKYLGIDCDASSSATTHSGLGKKYDKANKGATTFRDPESARRTTMLEIKPLDVMAWANTNHVAIIDSINVNSYAVQTALSAGTDLDILECTVVESNLSKGLNNSKYSVVSVDSNKVFTVHARTASNTRFTSCPCPDLPDGSRGPGGAPAGPASRRGRALDGSCELLTLVQRVMIRRLAPSAADREGIEPCLAAAS